MNEAGTSLTLHVVCGFMMRLNKWAFFLVVVSLMWVQRTWTGHRMGLKVEYALYGMKSDDHKLATGCAPWSKHGKGPAGQSGLVQWMWNRCYIWEVERVTRC